MQKLVLMMCVGAVSLGSTTQSGWAFPQFHKEFVKLYVKEAGSAKKAIAGSSVPGSKEPTFAELVTGSKTKCFVCHQGTKGKKGRNPYGQELGKLLTKKDKKDKKKIIESIEKVAKVHLDPKNKKSPTYGDLIKAGKLPGGTIEECKKKPKDRKPYVFTSAAGSEKKGSGKK